MIHCLLQSAAQPLQLQLLPLLLLLLFQTWPASHHHQQQHENWPEAAWGSTSVVAQLLPTSCHCPG
jgi:hypothetical protein